MRTTTLQCDRCKGIAIAGTKEEKTLDLMTVGFCRFNPRAYSSWAYSVPEAEIKSKADWCHACRVAMGVECFTEEAKKTPEQPTLEQQIMELLRLFVAENSGSAQ